MHARRTLFLASLLGALGVVLGAFGAHALEGYLAHSGLPAETQQARLDNWETAVRYHLLHVLALLAIGLWTREQPSRRATAAAGLFLLGMLLFSGCLYAYVLTGIRPLAMVVPLGGLALIAGWLALAAATWRDRAPQEA